MSNNRTQPIAGPSRSSPTRGYPRAIFDEFQSYPFTDDPDFKAGLPTVIAAVRGTKRSASQIDEMIGRAQWFYFSRMKGVQIPWEAYAHYSTASPVPLPSSTTPAGSPNSTPRSNRMRDPLAQLNNLAESRRMMADTGMMGGGGEGETGMSFAMLCRLISEGRTGEVGGIQEIPDQLNETPPSQSTLPQRPKPWEQNFNPNVTFPTYQNPTPQTYPPPDYTPSGYNPASFAQTTGFDFAGQGLMSPPLPTLTQTVSSPSTITQIHQSPSSPTETEWEAQTPGRTPRSGTHESSRSS